jgi:2-aminobenzoate-CoA ligase
MKSGRLVAHPSASTRPPPADLAAALLAGAEDRPGATALLDGSQAVSYGALNARVTRFAAALIDRGILPGDRVAIRLDSAADFIAAFLGVQRAGAIAVQLPPLYRRREIARVLSDSGSALVIGDLRGVCDAPRPCSSPQVPVVPAEALDADGHVDLDSRARRLDDPAVLTYVADIRGPLAGLVQTGAGLLAAADAYARGVLALGPTDVCIGSIGLWWAYGLGALLVFPMRAGAVTVPIAQPLALIDAIPAVRATVLFGVPTMYRMLLEHPGLTADGLRTLRACVSAGEPLPEEVAQAWRRRTGLDLLDGFGATELTHIVISERPGEARPGYLGVPVPGYEARIVGPDFRTLTDGAPGQLAVRGPTGAMYWRDPEAQRAVVREGWTLTRDICVREADGWFRYVRRADDIIVSAGYKISPREVEDALAAHDDVARARVFGAPDPLRGSVVKAALTPAAGRTIAVERLQQYLKRELAPYKCPREIVLE